MIAGKRVPEINGLRVDEAHKGGGIDSMAIMAANIRAAQMIQAANIAAAEQNRLRAEKEALLAKQEQKIETAQKKQDAVVAERKERIQNKELLTGTEVGIAPKKEHKKSDLISDTEQGVRKRGTRKKRSLMEGETPTEETQTEGLL